MVAFHWNPHLLCLRLLRLPHPLQPVHSLWIISLLRCWDILGPLDQRWWLYSLSSWLLWRWIFNLMHLLYSWEILWRNRLQRMPVVRLWHDIRRRWGCLLSITFWPERTSGPVLERYSGRLCQLHPRLHVRWRGCSACDLSSSVVLQQHHCLSVHLVCCWEVHLVRVHFNSGCYVWELCCWDI